jgi:ubiquinone/menaquinone biosynthesis C-methylase UbiE
MSTATAPVGRRPAWMPAVDEALGAAGRIADVGCGDGRSSIAIALAFPDALVDAIDVDARRIAAARDDARSRQVTGRVAFRHADAATLRLGDLPAYDVVVAPAHLGDVARRLARGRGVVVVRDELPVRS